LERRAAAAPFPAAKRKPPLTQLPLGACMGEKKPTA